MTRQSDINKAKFEEGLRRAQIKASPSQSPETRARVQQIIDDYYEKQRIAAEQWRLLQAQALIDDVQTRLRLVPPS